MDLLKYYTAILFDTMAAAKEFSESYHILPEGENRELNTQFRFPTTLTDEGNPCVVIYNLNDLTESDIQLVTIEKVNTEYLT